LPKTAGIPLLQQSGIGTFEVEGMFPNCAANYTRDFRQAEANARRAGGTQKLQ